MRADRLISLLMLLQTKGQLTAQELADRLEVSPRTIYRDLDALSASGVPVYAERGPNGGCRLLESYRTNLTGLRENEVRALFMFTVPGLLADLGADKDAESAFLKLAAALPVPFQQDAEKVQERLYLDASAWFQQSEATPFLPLLQEAVWQEQRVRIIYRRADGQWVKRLLDPYGLVAKAGVWYVVAAIHQGMMQSYRVSRIQEASLTGSTFVRTEAFDLAAYWENWRANFEASQERLTVTLLVPPGSITALAQVVGEGIHQIVAQAESPHGDGRLQLQLTYASLDDALYQLMGLGTAIELLDPPELRQRIRETAAKLLASYG